MSAINPAPLLSESLVQNFFDAVQASSYKATGAGDFNAQYQTILSRFDRYGYNMSLQNHEVTGFTFITRPKLNFATTSLRQDRILAMIDSKDPKSFAFALRCYLDTKYAHDINQTSGNNINTNTHLSANSPFFNDSTPFIVPLSNCLMSQSGWPDPVIDSETTQGGFFSEDQTFAKGTDDLNKTYDFTLTFRDIQGSFIISLFLLWTRYIGLVTNGKVMAYPEDIAARRLNYTCSIYRFVMDPSRQYIMKWAKATGCYPVSVPLGAIFNINEKESFISAAERIPIPFKVNKVEYMDPIIFRDFNAVVTRFCPNVASLTNTPMQPQNNFVGIPWINAAGGVNQLQWMAQAAELTSVNSALTQATTALNQALNTANPPSSAGGTPPPSANTGTNTPSPPPPPPVSATSTNS